MKKLTTITDSTALDIQRRFHPDLSVAFTVKHDQDIGWALPQSNDESLYAAVIEYFGEIRSSGRLAHIKEQHFGHVKQFNYVTTSLFIEAVDTICRNTKVVKEHSGTLVCLLAAISYQESLWNPRAIITNRVRGMMMLTLPTAKAMGVKSRLNAEQSIRGGARYLERMLERVPDRIPQPDRTWFALLRIILASGIWKMHAF